MFVQEGLLFIVIDFGKTHRGGNFSSRDSDGLLNGKNIEEIQGHKYEVVCGQVKVYKRGGVSESG